MSPEAALGTALLLPLVGALGVAVAGKRRNLREAVTFAATLATFAAVWTVLRAVLAGGRPELELFEMLPGIALAFRAEPLGMLFALVASGLWIVTSVYAVGYMRGHGEGHQTRFFVCFALAIAAALGIAFARNLATLFLFYEILTLTTYPLVTHHGTERAMRAGRVYLGVLLSTSISLLLVAILWTWQAAGTLEFRPGGILAGEVEDGALPWLLALFAFGTGKAALMPFHRWLPAAMVAPTPVSALLHAVAVVKAGVFTVLKVVVYVFGVDHLAATGASQWLMLVAAATILVASVVALTKDNLKARLAYSTISQLAYIVLGAALATEMAVLGGGLHIATHAVGKITLFFCAGAIYVGAHKSEISAMNGLGRRMPLTMTAFLLGSLSIIGLPPFGGSWSKWYLALGAAEGTRRIFLAVLMASSLLSIAYLMPVVVRAFFRSGEGLPSLAEGEPPLAWGDMREAPWLCVVPLCLTALGCVALFVWFGEIVGFLRPILEGGP